MPPGHPAFWKGRFLLMTLLWPWSLAGLLGVLGVALLALLRPARPVVHVGSLALWREALADAPRSARRRGRITVSWVALLIGAAAAVVGASRPTYFAQRPVRHVAVVVCPSVELTGEASMRALHEAVAELSGRLGAGDRVELILPTQAGGAQGWMSPAELRQKVASLRRPLGLPAGRCEFPQPAAEAQRTVAFLPAGTRRRLGDETVEIPSAIAPVAIDALAASDLPDGRVEVFVAARNYSSETMDVRIIVRGAGQTASDARSVGPQGRVEFVLQAPRAAAYRVQLATPEGPVTGLGAAGALARTAGGTTRVALVGRDSPALRRFVDADANLTFVADAGDADIVLCHKAAPPTDRPALVIDPPAAPPSWRAVAMGEPLLLAAVSVAEDDPVTRHVDLAGVAVRKAGGWENLADGGDWRVLAVVGDAALVLRNEPAAAVGPDRPPRQVWVSFPIAEEASNFARTPAFVVFLANAVRWLAPQTAGGERYAFEAPSGLDLPPSWEVLPAASATEAWDVAEDSLTPGLYRPADGPGLAAVSAVGLRWGGPKETPERGVAELTLPAPRRQRQGMELWPGLVLAAMGCWLVGWQLRGR